MDTITKARIISDFTSDYGKFSDDERYRDFFIYNDLGIPLAIMLVSNIVEAKDEGIDIINETYNMLCDILEIDKTNEYKDYDTFIEDSNIEDIDLEEE